MRASNFTLYQIKTLIQHLDQFLSFQNWNTSVLSPFPPDNKESTCNAGDLGLIPGSGRSPGEGNGNPLQDSCLKNPHGQRSLAGYSPRGGKEPDMTEWLTLAFCLSTRLFVCLCSVGSIQLLVTPWTEAHSKFNRVLCFGPQSPAAPGQKDRIHPVIGSGSRASSLACALLHFGLRRGIENSRARQK